MFHVLSSKINLSRIATLSALLFLLICTSNVSIGQTIHNFGQWQNLNPLYKTAYISGLLDSKLSALCEECTSDLEAKKLKKCLKELQIVVPEVVTMVDNFYLNSKNWGLTPHYAVDYQLLKGHCFSYIED